MIAPLSKPTVTLTYGLPGSGKTTSIKALLDAGAKRVSLDDLRAMFNGGGSWDQELEATVQDLAVTLTAGLVTAGHDVVVDNCHVVPRIPDKLRRVLAGKVYWAVVDRSAMPLEKCIEQDAEREHPVGAVAIRSLQQKMARNQGKGYYLSAEYMEGGFVPEPYVADRTKQRAVIVDIDGTLAKAVTRGPYDTTRYAQDEFHADVAMVVEAMRAHSHRHGAGYGIAVIVMSGRDSEFRQVTTEWLRRFCFEFDFMWMRPHGDVRRDSIIKAELFDEHVRNQYNVIAVFDDRDQVVNECWRAMGLRTYQVADGAF